MKQYMSHRDDFNPRLTQQTKASHFIVFCLTCKNIDKLFKRLLTLKLLQVKHV